MAGAQQNIKSANWRGRRLLLNAGSHSADSNKNFTPSMNRTVSHPRSPNSPS